MEGLVRAWESLKEHQISAERRLESSVGCVKLEMPTNYPNVDDKWSATYLISELRVEVWA